MLQSMLLCLWHHPLVSICLKQMLSFPEGGQWLQACVAGMGPYQAMRHSGKWRFLRPQWPCQHLYYQMPLYVPFWPILNEKSTENNYIENLVESGWKECKNKWADWNLRAVSASRLVKSPDSHASDPCSRLGGSSWLCYEKFISEFNEMPEIFWRHLAWKAESSLSEDELSCKVLGPAVYTKIYCRVQRNRVLFIPVQWENRVTLNMKRIEAGRQFPMIKQLH